MTTIIEGFRLGEPQAAGPLVVFPVFGPDPRLQYRAFSQAMGLGALIKELDSGASVRELLVENPTDQPVLIFEGEAVLGAQQNRTFDVSVLVGAGAGARVPVSCVEAGRWDGTRHSDHFAPAPQAADPSLRRVKRVRSNLAAAAGMPAVADQSEVWDVVGRRLADHDIESGSSAMADLYDAKRGDLAALADVVAPVEGQIGALAEVAGRPAALDLVSRADVFAALLPRLAQGYALDALDADVDEANQRAAEGFLHSALEAPRREVDTPGLGRGLVISATGIEGAGLEHEPELIQLSAFPAGEPGPNSQPQSVEAGRPIIRPSRRRRG
jgi:ARG/rhodanese/phosphatase superfamily protein